MDNHDIHIERYKWTSLNHVTNNVFSFQLRSTTNLFCTILSSTRYILMNFHMYVDTISMKWDILVFQEVHKYFFLIMAHFCHEVSKGAKIRNRYNQVPHLISFYLKRIYLSKALTCMKLFLYKQKMF